MTQQHRPPTAPLTGILSGDGTEPVRVTVYTSAVPTEPPAELADVLHPVYGDHGEVRDWLLGPSDPHRHVESEEFGRYRVWRAGFASDRFIGERALVRSLLNWAEHRVDTSALDILRLHAAKIDFHAALRMQLQIENASRVINASGESGLGLYTAPHHRAAARALFTTDPETLLLGSGSTRLVVGQNGLALSGAQPDDSHRGITGWRQEGDELRVETADGSACLPASSTAAALLRILGRQAPSIEVRRTPLGTLLAPLLTFLREASALAGETGTDLHIRSGWA